MVNDVSDGHVVPGIECPDRTYLNAYVPILPTSFQVAALLSGHLGSPFFGTTPEQNDDPRPQEAQRQGEQARSQARPRAPGKG
jgi:hypothetical protein